MASAKKRNHFIPRFLLNRFACRREPRKCWIWRYPREGEPIELSTRDAAVSTRFYGDPANGVEDAFAAAESEFGNALAAIDAGTPPNDISRELSRFVWTQAIRTAGLRHQFTDLVGALLVQLETSAGTEVAREALLEGAPAMLDKVLAEEIAKLPPEQRTEASAFIADPATRERLREFAVERVTAFDFQGLIGQMAAVARDTGQIERSAKSGQIRGLAKILEGRHVPESFTNVNWSVLEGAGTFVLGDSCVFGVSEDGRQGLLLRFGASWKEVYLPISSKSVLVGVSEPGELPSLDQTEINRTSAAFSSTNIFSSERSQTVNNLAALIGTGEPAVTEREMGTLVEEMWREGGFGQGS